jgi:hypothetical protein
MSTSTPKPDSDSQVESLDEFGSEPYKRAASADSRERLGAHRERIVLERPEWIGVITIRKRAE